MSDSTPQLLNRIQDDMKSAMLAKDQTKLSVLRMLKSAVKNVEIANPGKPLTDDLILSVIQKQLKKHQDSVEAYQKADRADLAVKEEAEAKILSAYTPEQINDEELAKAAAEVLEKNTLTSKKEFGKAMKLIQEVLQGRADNKRISAHLNKVLS